MNVDHRSAWWLMGVWCLVGAALLAGPASRVTALDPARVPRINFTEQSFDLSNFGKLTVIGAERKCRESLQAQLELLEETIAFSDDQRSKLQLAGELDIARFFASYADLKRKFQFGSLTRNQWAANVAKLQAEAQPIKEKFAAGLHGKSSLFAKTLVRTLDPEQLASVRSLDRLRANHTYANYIRCTLAVVDPQLPLSKVQRETITELMLQRTSPPESYGTFMTPAYRVLSRMGQIEDEIRALFSEPEWAAISVLIARAKLMANE